MLLWMPDTMLVWKQPRKPRRRRLPTPRSGPRRLGRLYGPMALRGHGVFCGPTTADLVAWTPHRCLKSWRTSWTLAGDAEINGHHRPFSPGPCLVAGSFSVVCGGGPGQASNFQRKSPTSGTLSRRRRECSSTQIGMEERALPSSWWSRTTSRLSSSIAKRRAYSGVGIGQAQSRSTPRTWEDTAKLQSAWARQGHHPGSGWRCTRRPTSAAHRGVEPDLRMTTGWPLVRTHGTSSSGQAYHPSVA